MHKLSEITIDPFSWGMRSGQYWRTTGDAIYEENVQRPPLLLVCKECRHALTFLMVAVCWTTHSVLREIVLLAGIQVSIIIE